MSTPPLPATPDRHPDDLPPPEGMAAPRRLPRGVVWAVVLAVVVLGVMLFVAGTGGDDGVVRLDGSATEPPDSGGTTGVGAPLPPLVLQGLDGQPVALADYRGAPLVVNFWASWCAPCLREMPDFETVSRERAGQVAFLGLNLRESAATAATLVERTGVTYDLALDSEGEAARDLGVVNMPTTVFVDASGTVVEAHAGALDAAELNARLDALFGA